MSEIKFACPHCQQHIECSNEYADMIIACPACGQAMLVPILSARDSVHPGLVVVASTPARKRIVSSRVPKLDPWTEEAWEEHVEAKHGRSVNQPLAALAAVLMVLPAISLLVLGAKGMSRHSAFALTFTLGLVCSSVAAWLVVREMHANRVVRSAFAAILVAGLVFVQYSIITAEGCCRAYR